MRGFLLTPDGFLYLNRTSDTGKDAITEATYFIYLQLFDNDGCCGI
jgi:hypothetical protein